MARKLRHNKVCCVKCFDTAEIKAFIEDFDTIGKCDYCGTKRANIAEISEVAEFIRAGVERVYEDAVHSVGWDSAEGGYLLSTTDLDDILSGWDIFSTKLDDPTNLLHDLGFFDGTPYVRKDPYGPISGGEEDIAKWEDFCKQVKSDRRFTILVRPRHIDPLEESEHPSVFMHDMVKWMFQELAAGIDPSVTIYRARLVQSSEQVGHTGLTSPPSSLARNNRMSPAGISFFYGTLDPDTAIAEVRPSIADRVAVASFHPCKNLHILDFSNIPPETSPFREDYYFHLEEFILPFLARFAEDISKPIRLDDAFVDYVPTQIFTEYIRFFESDENDPVNGLVYKSSMRKDGKYIVLFGGPDISSESECETSGSWLKYSGHTIHTITEVNLKRTLVDGER
jgi:hypothetical protein